MLGRGSANRSSADLSKVHLIALGQGVTDRRDEHERLRPRRDWTRPPRSRPSKVSATSAPPSRTSFAASSCVSSRTSTANGGAMMLELEQQASERLTGEVLRERQPDRSGPSSACPSQRLGCGFDLTQDAPRVRIEARARPRQPSPTGCAMEELDS